MTILYFYQYFTTPGGSWGTRVYEFARRWAQKGDKIIVVTSIYDKSDLKASGISTTMDFDGIEVIILNLKISNRHHVIRRLLTFIGYALLSSYYALRIRADIVIASSGPITVAIPGLIAHHLRRRKLIMEVRDLWPEGAIEMGMLKSALSRRFAFWLTKACYRASSKIVTLSPGMAEYIREKYGFTNVESVPNASDNELFSKNTEDFIVPGWAAGKKIFLYTGNIGKVNNSWLIVKAAELVTNPEVMFLFIGEGQQRQEIQNYIDEKNLSNIKILSLIPKNELVAWVQRAYFALVPLEGKPILDTSSPNKLFDAMAAGTPVIQTTQGWIKDLLERTECGVTVPFDSPRVLAAEINDLVEKPELRYKMGKNAKKAATELFDRDALSDKMYAIIQEVSQNA
ncbi:MAG: glycosyltransferase family 4 protein [Bacteroidota bacterium]|nr:glycosyltransferase family 4 protein [Bacteroidota bacterium]